MSGQNYTRDDALNISANWTTSGILNATVEHNGTHSFVNYTINNSDTFPGNWTNYTLNLSNTTEFPIAGNVTINAIYATDDYGQVNQSSGIRYFYLWSHANLSNISFYNSSILNGSNTTILCSVTDTNSSVGVPDYNVSFWANETYMGSNLTNSSGTAQYFYSDSSNPENDTYINMSFKCNITDQHDLFYNVSVPEKERNLTIADVYGFSTEPNVSVYNRGENITLALIDTAGNALQGVEWYANLTKYNETEQHWYNGTNSTVNITINTSDPVGNYTLFVNASLEGREFNQTWSFNISNELNPYFVYPETTTLSPSTSFEPLVKVNYSRNEITGYNITVNLSCSAGTLLLEKTLVATYGYVYKNDTDCTAPGAYSTSFSLLVTANDSFNNTGTETLNLITSSAPPTNNNNNNPGGGSTGDIPDYNQSCTCGEWASNYICGFSLCNEFEILETRECNPVDLCVNETKEKCVENPVCYGSMNFNFSLSADSINLVQGETRSVIVSVVNTGDRNLTINTSTEDTPFNVTMPVSINLNKNESMEFPMQVHAPLFLYPDEYIIILNISSRTIEKTKTLTVNLSENIQIPQIEQLEIELNDLENTVNEYREVGVYVGNLEWLVAEARTALEQAKADIDNDDLSDLTIQLRTTREKINQVTQNLFGKEIEKLLLENFWNIVIAAIVIIVVGYMLSRVLIPYYILGREILKLTANENNLVKARIETEKQYFRREIDEKTFNKILIEGQGKILRTRSQIKIKKEFRSKLIRQRLSIRSFINWLKRKEKSTNKSTPKKQGFFAKRKEKKKLEKEMPAPKKDTQTNTPPKPPEAPKKDKDWFKKVEEKKKLEKKIPAPKKEKVPKTSLAPDKEPPRAPKPKTIVKPAKPKKSKPTKTAKTKPKVSTVPKKEQSQTKEMSTRDILNSIMEMERKRKSRNKM